MSEATAKKEKKEKKRKSEAGIEPAVIAPEQGSASAEAVMMEVDGEKAVKKSKKEKKEKRKSLGVDGEGEEKDKKVSHSTFFQLETPHEEQSVVSN